MITMTVKIDEDDMAKLMKLSTSVPREVLKQWAVRYRSWAQERFDKFSKGGGDWPALALSTIKRRRSGKGPGSRRAKLVRSSLARDTQNKMGGGLVPAGGTYSILRDTGLLFNALDPVFKGEPGAVEILKPMSVEVGYGGSNNSGGKKTSIADIASYHQAGGKNLPRRKIIEDPPESLLTAMAGDLVRWIHNNWKGA